MATMEAPPRPQEVDGAVGVGRGTRLADGHHHYIGHVVRQSSTGRPQPDTSEAGNATTLT